MAAVIYIPVFHDPSAFQTTRLRGWFWLPHFAYGARPSRTGVKWIRCTCCGRTELI